MNADRIYDVSVIKDIVTRPEIWATVAEDGQDPAEFEPDMEQNCWLLMTDDTVIGLYQLKVMNGVTIELHPMVLPEFRSLYAKVSCKEALRWIVENAAWCYKVTASIPVIYKHVQFFAKGMGFRQEGVNRSSYLKGEVLLDQILFGITRDEMAEVI